MFRFFKQYAEWFVLGLTFLVVFLYYFFSPGVYGSTDNVTHFLYSRYAFQYPVFFLHPWARPLYTILSAPFAQFGFKSVQLLNVLLGMATAYYCYRIAKILDIHPSLPVILFVCFMPLYFIMMPTALTEILFSFVLVISFFLFLRRYFVAAAVVISFLPFARSEGFFLLPFYFLAFLYVKKYRAIPFLVVGTLLFSLAGWHYYKDFFWVFTQFPYQLHHPIYNQQGDLLHFLIYRDEIIGLPLEILFIAGTLQVTRELFSGDRALRDRTVILCLLSLTPFIFYLSFHSFLYWKGLGASIGLTRVLAGVLPLAAIICLKGFSMLLQISGFSKVWRGIVSFLVILLIVHSTFRIFPFPFPQSPEEETIARTSRWVKASPYFGKLLYYTDLSTPFIMGVNLFANCPPSCLLLTKSHTLDTIHEGSVIVWDAHFGGNESWILSDTILGHPRMKLIKSFKPDLEWTTFGGRPYMCLVFTACNGNMPYDNYAILDSLTYNRHLNFKEIPVYLNSFEATEPGQDVRQITSAFVHTGHHALVMDQNRDFSPGFSRTIRSLPVKPDRNSMISASVYIYPQANLTMPGTQFIISFEHENQSYSYTKADLVSQNLIPGKWNKLMLQVPFPEIKSPDDLIKVYIWNFGKQSFYMDDLRVDMLMAN